MALLSAAAGDMEAENPDPAVGGARPVEPDLSSWSWRAPAGDVRLLGVGSAAVEGVPHDRDDGRLETELFNVSLPAGTVDEAAAVDVKLRAGDVSAHHPALIHGSGPNTSTAPAGRSSSATTH